LFVVRAAEATATVVPMPHLPPSLRSACTICLLGPALLAQGGDGATTATTGFVVPGVRKVTLGGQYRLRYENQIDLDLDDTTRPDGNDFFTQRTRLQLGLDFSDRLAAFVQLQDVREFGEETSTLDDSADGLDLHQAYVDLRSAPGLGGTARLGRQELSLGDQRLVGALDWKSQARSFDGFRQTWSGDDGTTLLAWAFQVRETLMPANVNDDQWFGGVQGSLKPADHVIADAYLMLLHDDGTAPGSSANRFTLGTRWVWSPAPWELGLEVATQFGDQAGADIPIGDTYAGHVHATHRFDGAQQPWVKLECNVASGDDPSTADRERFDNLFPTAHAHWGMLDLAAWENLWNPMLQVGIKPCECSDLALSWNFFRSMEAGDRFGGPNGTLVPAGSTASRTIGNEIDVVYTRQLDLDTTAKTTFQIGYGAFLPGSAPESIGRDTVGHFVYAQFDVRF
jgi:hypothetical protein